MHPLGDMSTKAKMAGRAVSILNRSDLERWQKRSKTQFRFISIAFVIGALPITGTLLFGPGQIRSLEDFLFLLIPGFCCCGPIVLLPCWVLLNDGLNNYRRLLTSLKEQDRVCEVCQTVALYDDEFVHPSKEEGHTNANLVPHMSVIKKVGKSHVLCDACLAEVNAIDAVK